MVDKELLIKQFGEKWYLKLKSFFREYHYTELRNNVNRLYAVGQVLPESKNLFRAFREVDPDNIKVIIIGKEPYLTSHANGIAFSTDKSELPNDLELILNQVRKTTGSCTEDYTLKEWCDQGVLLLNCKLTARMFQSEHQNHRAINWESFILRILDMIVKVNKVAIIGVGIEAKSLLTPIRKRYVMIGNYVSAVEHPNTANNENREWESKNIFNNVNKFLEKKNIDQIRW